MQGVQGIRKSGRTRLAAYEEYSILGRCPECREGLVYAGEEGSGADLLLLRDRRGQGGLARGRTGHRRHP